MSVFPISLENRKCVVSISAQRRCRQLLESEAPKILQQQKRMGLKTGNLLQFWKKVFFSYWKNGLEIFTSKNVDRSLIETISEMFLLISWREESSFMLLFRGFYFPNKVSIPLIQCKLESIFSNWVCKKNNLEVSKEPSFCHPKHLSVLVKAPYFYRYSLGEALYILHKTCRSINVSLTLVCLLASGAPGKPC